ncbi:MAG: 2-C-methyl-D-erythritol 4-phosphate cytidylyltransferase [Clostridiales bacterium]|nr:MAG: 2-C-methyl-D-erythritol 4-phosphate cytidylyltransferase [Clostridiales bacterium]
MSNTAVILAAGLGKRMQAGHNKQFIEICGQSVLTHTLTVFAQIPEIAKIVLVVRAGEEDPCRNMIPEIAESKTVLAIGGKERQDSVHNGIRAITWECEYILIHDGARPLVTEEIIRRTLLAAKNSGAAICAVPVKDTIKQADSDGNVLATIPRESLWAVQTPQVFRADLIRRAYENAYVHNHYGTDDASLVEYLGEKIKIVTGDYENIKITTPEDIPTAEQILQKRQQTHI